MKKGDILDIDTKQGEPIGRAELISMIRDERSFQEWLIRFIGETKLMRRKFWKPKEARMIRSKMYKIEKNNNVKYVYNVQ